MSLTQSSVIGIIHCEAGLKCLFHLPKRLFPMRHIVSFSCIYILQRSVATLFMSGKTFNNHVIENCPQSVPVKEF